MKYNELTLKKYKTSRRVGRGIAGGQGKTAGRGTKGQKSRTGNGQRPGFEGGQNPLSQRLPKLRGFTSFQIAPENVYTGQLDNLAATITNQVLADAGLVSNAHGRVKLIVKGEVTKKHTIHLQAASAAAIAMVQKAGGSFVIVDREPRAAKTKAKKSS